MCKSANGLICVVLGLGDARPFEVEQLNRFGLTTSRCVDKLKASGARDKAVLSRILVAECMTTNDDWLLPARYKTRNAWDNNWFTKNSAASVNHQSHPPGGKMGNIRSLHNVPDGAVGR